MVQFPALRHRLIALNTGQRLARDSICRLALCPEKWMESQEPTDAMGDRLEVPAADVAEAGRLIRAADDLAGQQLQLAQSSDTQILTLHDPAYPEALLDLDLPPPVLYCRGRIPSCPGIAIVGSRNATPQGLEVAELFGRELAGRGLTVVSGFARGIDLAAHRGALHSSAGRTVAVLGCGLDVDYPSRRRRLRSLLPTRGALVSEFPFGSAPRALNFPVRNRIIAALSHGTLVVQGTPKSGSLITARLALDLGRDVYAVPGSIFDRRAAGPNLLIQDGALLVQHPEEIVESLPMAIRDSLQHPLEDGPTKRADGPSGELLDALSPGQMVRAEHLAAVTEKPLDEVLATLLELEIAGLIRRFPGPTFCRKP